MFPRQLPKELGGCRFPASFEGGAKFLRLRSHNFDPLLTQFAKDTVQPGSVVWDIGANVGLFVFAAAGLAGPSGTVVAVEPDIWLAGNLRRASRWNPTAAKVVVLPVAIADDNGLTDFVIAKNGRAVNYLAAALGSAVAGGVREHQTVPTLTLDCLAKNLPMPHVLKIDVEGAEAMVLAGAHTVLENRPTILIESSERTSAAVDRILSTYGYGYVDAATGQRTELPAVNAIATPIR